MSSPETYFTPVEKHEFPDIVEGYLAENVRVHFVFGPHQHPEHFDATAQLLTDCDIFIPEQAGWTEEMLEAWSRATKAKGPSLDKIAQKIESNFDDYTKAVVHEIGGTWKSILFIDVTDEEFPKEMDTAIKASRSTDYETVLRESYEGAALNTDFSGFRDKKMIENLGPQVTRKVKEHPKLRDKEQVNVLISLGTDHYPVYEYLRQQQATQDKVSATIWSVDVRDTTNMIAEEFVAKVQDNQPISRQDLVTFYISQIISNLMPDKPTIRTRTNHNSMEAKNRLIDVILKEDIEEVGRLVHRFTTNRLIKGDTEKFGGLLKTAGIDI